jgi:putative transposase
MKLVANLKLTPTEAQHEALLETLKVANRACAWLAGQAWETQTFGQFALHKLTYERCRTQFGLAAQMTVRCIAKVADAYKLDRTTRRRFRRYAAQPYDNRIFRLCSDTHLSLWTVHGRLIIPYPDFNAAQNIKNRAAVNRRMVAQPRQLRLALA